MKYAELKRRLAFAEREVNRAKADAYHYERECRRMVESRQDFERHTMREALAMMQRAIEYTPPLMAPICKCMEGEMRERFPAKTPLRAPDVNAPAPPSPEERGALLGNEQREAKRGP